MLSDARRESRAPSSGTAWLAAKGYGVARVTFLDQSNSGARLSVPMGLRTGSIVVVSSGADGAATGGRRGVVRWISADTVGVQFLTADRAA